MRARRGTLLRPLTASGVGVWEDSSHSDGDSTRDTVMCETASTLTRPPSGVRLRPFPQEMTRNDRGAAQSYKLRKAPCPAQNKPEQMISESNSALVPAPLGPDFLLHDVAISLHTAQKRYLGEGQNCPAGSLIISVSGEMKSRKMTLGPGPPGHSAPAAALPNVSISLTSV
jgi:hypothetical protein